MNNLARLSVLILTLVFSQMACAETTDETTTQAATDKQSTVTSTNDVDTFLANLKLKVPSMQVDYAAMSPMPGFYEVLTDGQLIYVSEDANYLLSGRLFGLQDGVVDLSAMAKERADLMRAPMRKAKIDRVPDEEMILFKADNEQYRVTVFTDVDCGWCRKLHREIPNYNERGISVQYLAYPRAGMGSSSYVKLRSVWCANDKQSAMDTAKLDQEFGTDTCADPIAQHLDLVNEFGIRGTPALVFESGRLLQSFLSPEDMLKAVKRDKETLAAANTPAQDSASD